ncbi:MAG: transrane protein [Bacteroidota bacterium]|nr:transrane protein [Bacteroidota bacterium]
MPRIKPLPINETPAEIVAAYELHQKEYDAKITNMKATLGHSLIAFEVYMDWYKLYERIKTITGERLAYLFAYSVSKGSNCPLCTTFFRKIIIDHGEKPEGLILSEEEQLLLDFGSAIAQEHGNVSDEIFEKVSKIYSAAELVELIAFAGQMIATNVFNNVIGTDIDEYLFSYLPFK